MGFDEELVYVCEMSWPPKLVLSFPCVAICPILYESLESRDPDSLSLLSKTPPGWIIGGTSSGFGQYHYHKGFPTTVRCSFTSLGILFFLHLSQLVKSRVAAVTTMGIVYKLSLWNWLFSKWISIWHTFNGLSNIFAFNFVVAIGTCVFANVVCSQKFVSWSACAATPRAVNSAASPVLDLGSLIKAARSSAAGLYLLSGFLEIKTIVQLIRVYNSKIKEKQRLK